MEQAIITWTNFVLIITSNDVPVPGGGRDERETFIKKIFLEIMDL